MHAGESGETQRRRPRKTTTQLQRLVCPPCASPLARTWSEPESSRRTRKNLVGQPLNATKTPRALGVAQHRRSCRIHRATTTPKLRRIFARLDNSTDLRRQETFRHTVGKICRSRED